MFPSDSDAFRSSRVPDLNPDLRRSPDPLHFGTVPPSHAVESGLRPVQPPADHGRLDRAARLMIAPRAIDETAGERQLIGSAVVLAQYLNRLIRRRFSRAVKLR
jgi:hypothetical protein